MFTAIEDDDVLSVNKPSDLKPGVYIETQLFFQKRNEKASLVVRQFKRDEDESCSVIDMIHIDSEKCDVIYQDFILMNNGEWQAGNGSKSYNLNDFLPNCFFEYVYTGSIEGDVIEVLA